MELLDPKNDYVFKRLFADSPDLLAALISAVRQGEPPVQVLQVLNPRILPEDIAGKAIELDVLARDSRGRLFNVEVQVQRFPRWSARSTFYLARLLGAQIGANVFGGSILATCEQCQQEYTPKRSDSRFCGAKCRVAYHRAKQRETASVAACIVCGVALVGAQRLYCSKRCNQRMYRRRYNEWKKRWLMRRG